MTATGQAPLTIDMNVPDRYPGRSNVNRLLDREITEYPGRIACHYGVRRRPPGDHGACAHNRAISDGHAR